MQNWKVISLVSIFVNIILIGYIIVDTNKNIHVAKIEDQARTPSIELEQETPYLHSNTYNFDQGFSVTLPGDLMRISLDGSNTIGSYGEETVALFTREDSSAGGEFTVSISNKDPGEALLAEYKKIPNEQIEYGDFGYSKPELFVKTSKNTFYKISVSGSGSFTDTIWTKKGSKYIVFTFMGGDVMERYKGSIILSYKETN